MRSKKEYLKSHISTLLWGFFMHLILLWGVMDANFHSPIIRGLPIIEMPKGAPAKRIFIFLADGLRYRTLKDHIPPFLNSIIQNEGVWGISHTQMPTESRPGNIAVVAGLYEDPSAVFKGWKENPVEFDSVFNHSRASWLWGSPDIVSLFTKGDKINIHGDSYPPEWQDFSKEPGVAIRLDDWVFNQYLQWLSYNAFNYKTEDKIVFYFHLLGCDTSGHTSKPHSKDYIETIMNVDKQIERIVQVTENYFGRGSTAYIFTADHGMTDWGSHGSGSIDETETPFVAWGAGITKDPRLKSIKQADITPLISTLIGISIPSNNEGILPYEFIDKKYEEFIAKSFLINAKQLAEQVKANRELNLGQSLVNLYSKDKDFGEKLIRAERFLKKGRIRQSINECKYATKLAKDSLFYYRRYQTNRFLCCLMIMWLGWIATLFVDLSGEERSSVYLRYFPWKFLADASLTVSIIPLFIEYAVVTNFKEWRLFSYGIICFISIWHAFKRYINKEPTLTINSNKPLIELMCIILLTLLMYIGLKYRWVFSIAMLITTLIQKIIFYKRAPLHLIIAGTALAIFPVLPVVGSQQWISIVLITLTAALYFIINERKIYWYNKLIEFIRLLLTSLICSNVIDGRSWLSWVLLFSTPFVIWLYPKTWNQRYFGITMALLSPLALLSTSYEPLFFGIFSIHLRNWSNYEYLNEPGSTKSLKLRDFSTAASFMLYTLLCFFGTGNMASISSFDPSWTRHFLTIFSPFTMSALILLKTMIPLMLLGCLVRVLSPDSRIFSAVLLLGDCLAIPLMYEVTTQGSWLDIGSGISRFVIAIVLPCLLLLVYYLSKPLSTFNLQEFIHRKKTKYVHLKI